MFDVPYLHHPIIATEVYQDSGAIEHNAYKCGRYVFEANFRSNLGTLAIAYPTAPTSADCFDVFPSDDTAPSGTLVVRKIERELSVPQPTFADWPPAPPEELHLDDLTGQATDQPNGRWLPTLTATVYAAEENLEEGATWTTGASGSCTTGSDGQCPISLGLPDTTSRLMLKVHSLTRDNDSYVAASDDVSDIVDAPAADHVVVPEWFANHEDGTFAEWDDGGGLFNTKDYTVENSAEQAHTGTRSVKTTIDTTEGTSAVRLFRWAESSAGADLYYSAWAYFPEHVAPSLFWTVFQFKSKRRSPNEHVNDPIFTLTVGNDGTGGAMRLELYYHGSYLGGANRSYDQSLNPTDLPVGRWVHFEAFLHQAGNATGVFRFWQDGMLIFDITNKPTRHPDGDNQWSLANYSDNLNPPVATIYFDDAVISTERVYGRAVKGVNAVR